MKGNSKTAPPHQPLSAWQAERAGSQEPEASGIKAGWPRFDKKRGAQPASPTAVRRDALGFKIHLERCPVRVLLDWNTHIMSIKFTDSEFLLPNDAIHAVMALASRTD